MKARYENLTRRLINLAVHSVSNNISSFRSYFQSKKGYLFETPDILRTFYFVTILLQFICWVIKYSDAPIISVASYHYETEIEIVRAVPLLD